MKIAILSDIHSNAHALTAVLKKVDQIKVSRIIILGDIFGYYPWAVETYKLISHRETIIIKGNHDALVYEQKIPEPCPVYWKTAKDNEKKLKAKYPQALKWLKTLKFQNEKIIEDIKFLMFHGTPENPKEGRFYPDNAQSFSWFPGQGEIVLLGHTHYPMERRIPLGGIILNPGSVGQPRDGNPFPSWCVLDTRDLSIVWERTKYDYLKAIKELEDLNWDKRFIMALQKTLKGSLHAKII